ncbi:hypothetical protein PV327_004439 [Microctonus hyperodae]|uniref:Sas10 C-terminal domain-containing protein n=1 Tax=Microctonus hyperodae TaxID=165561 RepID=A0AA39FCQ5_MICHY|nr:hypothetical protein PV327_004439 [Microctonus hyperodae]
MGSKKKSPQDFGDITKFDEDDITDDSDDELLPYEKKRSPENFDSEDEVYGLHADDDDDDAIEHDSMESDIERPQEDDDLPDERAWGKKKKAYFAADYVDADYATTNEKDMEKAELEEEMARKIQKNLAEQLDDADFGLDLLKSSISMKENEISDDKQIVKTDLSTLSKRERQDLFQKENPEFQALVANFEERLVEAKNILLPFLKLASREKIAECPALNLIKIKYHLILNYSVNLSFYLELKAKKIPIISHPVIKRLAQLRQLIGQLEAGQGDLINEASEILKAAENGEPLYNVLNNKQIELEKVKKRKLSEEEMDEDTEQMKKISKNTLLSFDESSKGENDDVSKGKVKFSMDEDASDSDEDKFIENEEEITNENINNELMEDEKRPINYKIAKNKGLTPYRKKELRNPRVKHRNKYRKAKIRRKGAVREVRKEITRYAGEISGIKASLSKSRKLK